MSDRTREAASRMGPAGFVAGVDPTPGMLAVARRLAAAMEIVLPEARIGAILEEAEHVLRRYVTTDGTVAFDTFAHIVTGMKAVTH